jgi:hypothetical protein
MLAAHAVLLLKAHFIDLGMNVVDPPFVECVKVFFFSNSA